MIVEANPLLLASGGVDLSEGLFSYYTMDNISGSTLVDDSGNGNDGTISGATISVAGGVDGNDALDFDGGNDFVSGNPIIPNSIDATVSCWVYIDAAPGGTEVIWSIERTASPAGNNRGIVIAAAGFFQAIIRDSAGGNASVVSAAQSFPNWFNLQLVQDNDRIDFYLGVLGGSLSLVGSDTLAGSPTTYVGPERIGCRVVAGPANNLFFDGKVDIFRTYDEPKDAAFAQALFREV